MSHTNKVTFPERLEDGWYTGKWFRYDVTIEVDGKEIVGKCEAGTTGEDFDFCSVKVENGQAVLHYAL